MIIPTVARYNESGDCVKVNVGDDENLAYYAGIGYKFDEQPKQKPTPEPEEIEDTEDEEKPRRGRPAQKKR